MEITLGSNGNHKMRRHPCYVQYKAAKEEQEDEQVVKEDVGKDEEKSGVAAIDMNNFFLSQLVQNTSENGEDDHINNAAEDNGDDDNSYADNQVDDNQGALATYLFKFGSMVQKFGVYPKNILRQLIPDSMEAADWQVPHYPLT